MRNIVERLRSIADGDVMRRAGEPSASDDLTTAANVIEAMKAALTPFSRASAAFSNDGEEDVFKISSLRVRHLRAAADALGIANTN